MPNALNYLIAKGSPGPSFDLLDIQQKALNTLASQREAQAYPEDRNWLREQRGMLKTKYSQEQDDRLRELQKRPFKDHIEALTTMVEEGPMISYENYPASREWFIKHGVRPEVLPPPESFGSPEAFEAWKSQQLPMAKKQLEEMKAKTEYIKATKPDLSEKGKTSRDYQAELKKRANEIVKKGEEAGTPIPYEEAVKLVESEIRKDFYPDKEPKTPPSAGNAVDLAIKRKFGTDYLSDPTKSKEADKWLATEEGRSAVIQARDDLTPPAVTYLPTSEGFVPAVTRGPGVGTTGKPTELRKPLSDAQLAKVGELNAVLKNIDKTKELYGYGTGKEHEEWVGPIAGRKGGLESKYTGTASPEQVKFYSYVKDMQDALLRARSGAQINEQEYSRLVNFLPDPNLPPKTFKAKLERFQEATQIVMDEKLKAYQQGGFGVENLKSPGTDFRKKYNY